MKIYVFVHGMKPNSEITAYLKRRLLYAVSRFATRIERIEAGLIDVNGERGGGGDKRCRIVANVAGMDRLVLHDDDADLLPLIDRTANRLGHLVRLASTQLNLSDLKMRKGRRLQLRRASLRGSRQIGAG